MCLVKKVFLNISQNPQENTCARAFFLIKLQPATLLKKGSGRGFSSELCEIFKNTVFYRKPPVAASEILFEIGKLPSKFFSINLIKMKMMFSWYH